MPRKRGRGSAGRGRTGAAAGAMAMGDVPGIQPENPPPSRGAGNVGQGHVGVGTLAMGDGPGIQPENPPPSRGAGRGKLPPQQIQLQVPGAQAEAPPHMQASPPVQLQPSIAKPLAPVLVQEQRVLPPVKAVPFQQEPATKKALPPTADVAAVTQALSAVQMAPRFGTNQLSVRPGYGRAGRPIRLVSNNFPMNIPDGNVYHYDVEIEPLRTLAPGIEAPKGEIDIKATPQQVSGKRLSSKISREVMMRLFESESIFKGILPAYDGNKNLFTRRPISIGSRKTILLTFREEGRDMDSRFKISIQPVEKDGYSNVINLNCLHELFKGQTNETCYQAIMALDIIMRAGPALKLNPIGRSFFMGPRDQSQVHPLSEGKQVWFGHYQSIRPAQWKPMIILDKSATTFYKPGPLVNYTCEFFSKFRRQCQLQDLFQLRDYEIKDLSKDLKNVQICVTHLPYRRRYRVVRVTRLSASNLTFPEKQPDGTTINTSVADYFKKNYKPLKFPNLPCIQVNPENKKIFQPMEVCEIVDGQHYKRKLTEDQTSEMIKFTATTPRDRFNDIQQSMNQTLENSQKYMKEFGIQIDRQPLHLEGRVISAPQIMYGGNKPITPRDGAWDLRDTRFFKGARISSWVILCLANERQCNMGALQNLGNLISNIAVKMDMNMGKLESTTYAGNRGIPAILQELKTRYKTLGLVVVVLPDRGSHSDVKFIAETKLGLLTSCILYQNVNKKCNPQLVCNVLQKINAKLGGQNSMLLDKEIVPILQKPVIIIGADVSHSAPGDKVRPSVAAAVGSLDKVLHHYAACIEVQKSRNENKQHLEIIMKLKEMVIKLLKAFYMNTRQKPEKIIMYRDGVSEGEFATVQHYEVKQIQDACLELQKDGSYKPGITFVVVQKRHHTRFAPEDSRDGVGKCKNVPPGTTVDKLVTHPVDHDFYLCSHFGIQGTSRPAHYTVLRDDNNLTADDLQKMSYQLCHTYVRCTRSISIPAPVMYAHLAALRARQHLASANVGGSDSSSEYSEVEEEFNTKGFEDAVKVMDEINKIMYFV